MLDLSPEKLLIVGFIAFVVLGPDRLPQAARSLGRVVAHLRRVSSGFQTEVRSALSEPTDALQSALGDWRPPTNLRKAVRDTVTSTFIAPPDSTNGSPATSNGSSASSVATPSADAPTAGTAAGRETGAATAGRDTEADGAAAGADTYRTVWEQPAPVPDDPSLN